MEEPKKEPRDWINMSDDEQALLENDIVDFTFDFLYRHQHRFDEGYREDFERPSVRQRAEQILRDLVLLRRSAAFNVAADNAHEVREAAKTTLNALRRMRDQIGEVPAESRAIMERIVPSNVAINVFSAEFLQVLDDAIFYCERHARSDRGRPTGIEADVITDEVVRAVTYVTRMNFVQNFDTHEENGRTVFLHPQAMLFEELMKRLDPNRIHEEIKYALKKNLGKKVRKMGGLIEN